MPWWKSANPSSPPPSSPSSTAAVFPSSSSPPRLVRKDLTSFGSQRGTAQPCLTRQRKLRHLTDEEVSELAADDSGVDNSKSTPVSRSQSSLDHLPVTARSFSSAVLLPRPLPRPESTSVSPHREFHSTPCPLPSPKGPAPGGSEGEEGNGALEFPLERIGERLSSVYAIESRLAHPTFRKSPEHAVVPPPGSIPGHSKNRFRDSSAMEINLRQNATDRSMPTSGFSSPMISPGRLSTGDLFPSSYMAPQVPQMWSAPEFPSSDFIPGFSLQNTVEKVLASPEHSPLYSSGLRTRNPSAPSSPLHPRMFSENSHGWHDNNGNVSGHPLPLPPGAPTLFQPTFSHQNAKVETSTTTNQWLKGKLIGSGTFGNVYIATNRQTGALCAMKEVNLIPDDPKSAECIRQLQQEIKLLSRLKHQNIVQYYGSEIIEDRFYIYLEYVYPGSINKYVHEHCGAITESVVRNFTRHILRGLAYLHSTKTMHRDIKGANLLVNSCGVVKLADFGMAKHLSGAKDVLSMKGTPYWMAPEVLQATMNEDISYDFSVDIWSLGCTIIEMFTRKHPWCGFESAAAMFKVLHESPQIPETLSAEGTDFLQLCFRRNPTERPTASQLLNHPFITNSHHHDLHGSIQTFAGIKLSDASHSPRSKIINIKSDSNMKGRHSSYGYDGISPPMVPFNI